MRILFRFELVPAKQSPRQSMADHEQSDEDQSGWMHEHTQDEHHGFLLSPVLHLKSKQAG